jgi:predicted 2-oxoglutarate/Fe(II)-dependent dioxygenase YbiX
MIAQYYDDGDFYRSHFDDALFSVVTTLYQTPREFSGGRFVFPEFDYWLDLEDNMSVIFPSVLIHEVEPVTIKKSGELLGRFSVTSFITHK